MKSSYDLDLVRKQYIRFLNSGLKPKFFTNYLYDAFYIHSNLFIAHFNKQGFYETRFNKAKGLVDTVHILLNTGPRNETHKVLREVTKDCIQYLENYRQSLIGVAMLRTESEMRDLQSQVNDHIIDG